MKDLHLKLSKKGLIDIILKFPFSFYSEGMGITFPHGSGIP